MISLIKKGKIQIYELYIYLKLNLYFQSTNKYNFNFLLVSI